LKKNRRGAMSNIKHTPTPWKTEKTGVVGIRAVINSSDDKHRIGTICGSTDSDLRDEANAAFIVLAVNAHEELLEAAKLWTKFWDEMPKGQLGKIVCNIGTLNDAFLKTASAIKKATGA
jgi:hypothetical protein